MSLDRSSKPIPSGRFSPLRYPGGKGKLAAFVADVVKINKLSDGLYVEPYAGGAAVAWELLLTGVVRDVAINDISWPIYAFWKSVLERTNELISMIRDTPVTVETRMRVKEAFMRSHLNQLDMAFAIFFLNRTNRSGILNGGMIGGKEQKGRWKIDARYNKEELVDRIARIARMRRRISVTNMDAVDFLREKSVRWNKKTLVYLDPPYFDKGPDLYPNFYKHGDHAGVASAVRELDGIPWIVSYDDVRPIHNLYAGSTWLQYTIGYSARARVRGREAMFSSPGLTLPNVKGSMVELDRWDSCSDEAYRLPQEAENMEFPNLDLNPAA